MGKSIGIRVAACLVALAGLWTAATQQQPTPLETVKIADDLYVITGDGGNVGVYVTDEGVILIDDKFDRDVPQIIEKVKSITDKPIRYVLNTHHHGDHTGGNPGFMKTAEIIAHENARKLMVANGQPGLPRITFSERTVLNFGGKQVHAYYYGRGHTSGDAIIYFPQLKTVHTGDLFIGNAPFIDYGSGGSGLEWPATLAAAEQLDFDTVIPGHGPVSKRADLLAWKKSFETVIAKVKAWKKDGKSKEEVGELLDVAEAGWQPSRSFTTRSLPGLYDEIK